MEEDKQELSFFEELKELRKSKNIDLKEIANSTKINIKYLESIEKGNFEALPDIYIRLFIRTYSKYLNADSQQILTKYEKHTNTKNKTNFKKFLSERKKTSVKKTDSTKNGTKKDNTNKENNVKNIKFNNTEKEKNKSPLSKSRLDISPKKNTSGQEYFYDPNRIIKIFATIFSIIAVYLLVSFLSKEQKSTLNSTEKNKDSNNSINIVVDNTLISNNNFDESKLLSQKHHKLKFKINEPYTFKIVTNERTKINISYDSDDGKRLKECNIIAPKDTLLKFEKNNDIYFDLWNSNHIQISINDNPISKYLDQDNALIRGSFSPKNKKLHIKSYSH